MHEAISSGIFNDLGSGGNVDITVITADGVDIKRSYDAPNARKYKRPQPYHFAPGTVRMCLSFSYFHHFFFFCCVKSFFYYYLSFLLSLLYLILFLVVGH